MTKEEKSMSSESKTGDEHPVKEKSARQRGQKRDKVKPLTKIIIRHLPPTMTEEEFLKQIDPLPDHDFYYFAAADWSLGYDATCRAYLNLKNYDDVFLFRDRFDGYVFVDSKGAEYAAIVEFAPFQGLAKNKSRKTDPKVNSIELETHYKNFLAKLEEDRELAAKGGESKLEFSLDRKKEEKITSTPLLQYLANKKEKRREESKRRTEEKRRQREEEKERRQKNQQQVTKIMTGQDGGAGKRETSGKSTGSKENADNPHEEQKNSRSKRRLERNQRRREAYEQKKREKEILEKEQKEKGASSNKTDDAKLKKESTGKSEEVVKSFRNEDKSNDTKTEDTHRKESKKYSERRERDRNRNRREKEKEAERNKDAKNASTQGCTSIQVIKSSKEIVANSSAKDEEVSETVKNFIRSVVAVKEFVPKHKQLEAEEKEIQSKMEVDEDLEPKKRLDSNTSIIATDERNSAERVTKSKSESSDAADERQQTQKQRLAEEKRIRNKDRPSIAIYQPKPRLRQSEESDTNAAKDARSNPTSDCESVKKDEQRVKKVSRYSERRSERRSKDKRKESIGEISNAAELAPELQKSISTDEFTSAKEKYTETQDGAN